MTLRARLFVALSLALSTVAAGTVRPARADDMLTAFRLMQQPTPGQTPLAPAQPGTPQPGQTPTSPQPAPSQPIEPMLGDVAGPAKPISLPVLLQLAVRQAPALAQAQIDIEIAEANILASQAWADWAVQAQLAASTRSGSGQFSRSDTVTVSGDLTKRISTGGTMALHAEAGWSRAEFVGGLGSLNQFSEEISAQFTQPLLRDRGNIAVEGAQRVARANRDAAAVARRAVAIEMVRTVVLAYLDLVDAERQLEIRRASLDLAKERLRVTEAGIDKGGVARAEMIPVEQAIATREEEVLVGEMTILDQSLALRRQVALPVAPGDMVLASTVDLAIPSKTWSQSAIVDAAAAQSPELARLAALEKGATIEVEVTENGLLARLDLSVSVGPTYTTTEQAESEGGGWDNDLGVTAAASLTYQQSLGKSAARAAVHRSRAALHSIQVTETDIRNQLVEAAARAVANIQVAERRYAIAVRAVTLAEQNLQVEQARMGLGKSRNVDVLERQDELRAAQLRVQQAITDWHRSAAVIAALTGEILPQYGITLEEG